MKYTYLIPRLIEIVLPLMIFVWPFIAVPQVTMLLEVIPGDTLDDDEIFITGDFEGWSGNASAYRLLKESSGAYTITLPQREGSIKYKFTKGGWASVERGPNGEDVPNRIYSFGGNGDTVSIQIANWAAGFTNPTVSPNVSVANSSFSMLPYFNRERTIRIYLPPDYGDNPDRHYPVLYMQDGQNLFDRLTSFAGEWHVDETLDKLFEEQDFGLIVVGIDNGADFRTGEYTPWFHPEYGGGDGDLYVDFMVNILKPYIDEHYRTATGSVNTGIMGSSFGGLISHYAALKYPDVFGRAGVFSPSFWFSDSCYIYAAKQSDIIGARHYFMGGTNEHDYMVVMMDEMIKVMNENGFVQSEFVRKVVAGGEHNEALWSSEFEAAVKWLFPELLVSNQDQSKE